MQPVNPDEFKGRSTFAIDPEHLQQYRDCVAGLDIPEHEIDELIGIVISIMGFFVDSAFNVQTDQITLRSAGNGFNAPLGRDTIPNHPENQSTHARGEGGEGDSNQERPTEP